MTLGEMPAALPWPHPPSEITGPFPKPGEIGPERREYQEPDGNPDRYDSGPSKLFFPCLGVHEAGQGFGLQLLPLMTSWAVLIDTPCSCASDEAFRPRKCCWRISATILVVSFARGFFSPRLAPRH